LVAKQQTANNNTSVQCCTPLKYNHYTNNTF